MPSVNSPDGDDIGYGPSNPNKVVPNNTGINGTPPGSSYAGPTNVSNHDYNQANGMSREQYRDAWMNSGVNTIQGQQDWLAKNGGQIMSGNGTAQTPYGDILDMQIGARTGNGRPGWTTVGNSKPSDFYNQQMDLSGDMTDAQQQGQNQWQAQQPQQYYAGSEAPVDKRNMLSSGQPTPINSGTASPSSSFYAPPGSQDIAAGYNPINKPGMITSGNNTGVGGSIPMEDNPRVRQPNYAAPTMGRY